jgi:hypothetical protein
MTNLLIYNIYFFNDGKEIIVIEILVLPEMKLQLKLLNKELNILDLLIGNDFKNVFNSNINTHHSIITTTVLILGRVISTFTFTLFLQSLLHIKIIKILKLFLKMHDYLRINFFLLTN